MHGVEELEKSMRVMLPWMLDTAKDDPLSVHAPTDVENASRTEERKTTNTNQDVYTL